MVRKSVQGDLKGKLAHRLFKNEMSHQMSQLVNVVNKVFIGGLALWLIKNTKDNIINKVVIKKVYYSFQDIYAP